MTYIHILKYAIALTMPLNKLHIMFLAHLKSVIFYNMVCESMPTVTHKLQKQHQKPIHKKNRILIVNGDNPDNHAILPYYVTYRTVSGLCHT